MTDKMLWKHSHWTNACKFTHRAFDIRNPFFPTYSAEKHPSTGSYWENFWNIQSRRKTTKAVTMLRNVKLQMQLTTYLESTWFLVQVENTWKSCCLKLCFPVKFYVLKSDTITCIETKHNDRSYVWFRLNHCIDKYLTGSKKKS